MSAYDAFDWFWKLCAVATPFVVMGLNLRSSAKTNERKLLMENIDSKINAAVGQVSALGIKVENGNAELHRKIDVGNNSCRENVEAVQRQVHAFQVDVARSYPTKNDLKETYDELRRDLRSIDNSRNRSR